MTIVIFVFGLIIGSFLNVCIYRIPRQESIVFPGSRCIYCGRQLGFLELVPVLGFLLVKGKCRSCRQSISWRYPAVELLTGFVFYLEYLKYGMNLEFITLIVLSSLMIVVTFIDIDYRIIPNKLVLFGLISGIILGFFRRGAGPVFMGYGLAVGFGLLFLVAILSRWQMGFGDVKLAAVMGVFLGLKGVLAAILIAFAGGAVYGIFLILFRGKNRKTAVPFGPFLAGAAVISFIWAESIIAWYLDIVVSG